MPKVLDIEFSIIEGEPEGYIGYVGKNGEKLGDEGLWENSPLLSDEWDKVIEEAKKK